MIERFFNNAHGQSSYDVLNDEFIQDDLICDDGELFDVDDLPYSLPQGFIKLPTT